MTVREWRVFTAICALAVGVLICLHQRHFILVPWMGRSWVTMLGHRCGMVFAASLLWATVECSALLAWSMGGRRHRRSMRETAQ